MISVSDRFEAQTDSNVVTVQMTNKKIYVATGDPDKRISIKRQVNKEPAKLVPAVIAMIAGIQSIMMLVLI